VVSRCVRCKRHEQKGIQVVPGTLLEDRVRDASVFEVTGVDLAGHLFLRGKAELDHNVYMCSIQSHTPGICNISEYKGISAWTQKIYCSLKASRGHI
jgi:hypothetical protein